MFLEVLFAGAKADNRNLVKNFGSTKIKIIHRKIFETCLRKFETLLMPLFVICERAEISFSITFIVVFLIKNMILS